MQYLTAYGALIDVAQMKAGDVVLISAASSSVGLAAIQLANLVGATPIALTRRSEKAASLHAAGAEHVITTEERPIIARTFPLDDIVAAHRFLESNAQFGKIVVTV